MPLRFTFLLMCWHNCRLDIAGDLSRFDVRIEINEALPIGFLKGY